jgi:hypothetical protein
MVRRIYLVFLLVIAGLSVWALARDIGVNARNIATVLPQSNSLQTVCAGQKNSDFECQKAYYKSSHESGGVKAAFADLRKDYETTPSIKTNCHQLTHVIGRAAGEKYGDVSKAYADGDTFCWSGYYHGVMEAILAKYDGQNVKSKLNDICVGVAKESRYSFRHYNCAHGLGHGVMLIEADELFDSLADCDGLSDDWERKSCYGGVYMENIMARINPDHDTKYLRDDEPMYPCTAVGERYKEQCYLMQTSHALSLVNQDFKKVFGLCAETEITYRTTCYQSLGRDASGNSSSNVATTHGTCMLGESDEAKSNCVIGAVKDFVSYYHGDTQATEFCNSFDAYLQGVCHTTKTSYFALLKPNL